MVDSHEDIKDSKDVNNSLKEAGKPADKPAPVPLWLDNGIDLIINPDHPDFVQHTQAEIAELIEIPLLTLTIDSVQAEWRDFHKQASHLTVKLNKTNYHTWRMAVLAIFRQQVPPRITRLLARTIGGHPTAYRWYGGKGKSKGPDELASVEAAKTLWMCDDSNLASFLLTTMTEEMYSFAAPTTGSFGYDSVGSGTQVWAKLEARYQEQSTTTANSIKRAIVSARQGNRSVQALADFLDDLFLQYLRATNCVFGEEDKVNVFLSAIEQASLKPFIGSITRELDDGRAYSFQTIVTKAVAEESLYPSQPPSGGAVQGHPVSMAAPSRQPLQETTPNGQRNANTPGQPSNKGGAGKPQGTGNTGERCAWCRNRNHTAENCRRRLQGYPPTQDRQQQGGNNAWAAAMWSAPPPMHTSPWPTPMPTSYSPMMAAAPPAFPSWPYPSAAVTPSAMAATPAAMYGPHQQFVAPSGPPSRSTTPGMAHAPGVPFQPYNHGQQYSAPTQGQQSQGSAFAFTYPGSGHPFFGQLVAGAGDIIVANGQSLPITGIGNVIIQQQDRPPVFVQGVYHVPGMACGLISTGLLTETGSVFDITISQGQATVTMFDQVVIEAQSVGCVYPIVGVLLANAPLASTPSLALACQPTQLRDQDRLWHHRLGHISHYALPEVSHTTTGLPWLSRVPSVEPCKGCLYGKRAREPFPPNEKTATQPLELVHVDIGYSDVHGLDGSKYFIVFVDDYSRRLWVYCIANQTAQTLVSTFQRFVADAQAQTPCEVRRVHGDNQFNIKLLTKWCHENQISLSFTVPHSPQMNGRAERVMRSLKEPARTMLIAADLPLEFWPYAVHTAAYIRNRVPHRSLGGASPHHLWFGQPPDLGHLRVFGCLAWPMLQYNQRENGPWASQSVQGIFVGYGLHDGVYLVYLPDSKRVISAREVHFDEASIWRWSPTTEPTAALAVLPDADTFVGDVDVAYAVAMLEDEPFGDVRDIRSAIARPHRLALAIYHFGVHITSNQDLKGYCSVDGKPVLLRKLATDPEWPHWVEAAKAEVDSLMSMDTFTPVTDLPPGKRGIGTKWVFSHKHDVTGKLVKHKARLVVQGHNMRQGIDYTETFSPVVGLAVLRQLVVLAARFGMIILMFDVITAYLNALTTLDVYVHLPELFPMFVNASFLTAYLHVNRALYGMCTSGREWFHTLRDKLLELGFEQSPHEPCLFVHNRCVLAVYVDDLFVLVRTVDDAEWVTQLLMAAFKMRKSPASSAFVGMTLERGDNVIRIHQRGYIEDYLSSFGYTARGYGTPMDPTSGGRLRRYSGLSTALDKANYISKVGRLLWISGLSRPDTSFSTSKLSRYSSNPGPDHRLAIDHHSLYLKRTIDLALVLECKAPLQPTAQVEVYTDSDHAGDLDTRRSTTGYIVTIDGMPVAWRSKLQSFTAESSTAAEYVAAATASTEALIVRDTLAWLWNKLGESSTIAPAVILHCDSAGAVANASQNSSANRTRTVDIKYHVLRDHVSSGRTVVQRVEGKDNPADALTKPLSSERIQAFCKRMGLK